MATKAPETGDRLGPYILEERIGVGGFGEVWRARHSVLPDKVVAAKIPTDPGYIELLRREGILQHSLRAPSVVELIDLDIDHDPPYLLMEYVEGEDLRTRIDREAPLPVEEALGLARQVLETLALAHDAGVVHQDLKPGNVLLDTEGRVKLADFGLGKTVDASRSMLLVSRSMRSQEMAPIAGTLAYMSPEQRTGEGPIDGRTDIFAFGVLFFEMLTGRLPAGIVFPGELVEGIDPRLDGIYRACCAPLETRYPSAAAVLADLEAMATPGASISVERPPVAARPEAAPEESRIILRSPHAAPTRLELEGADLLGHEGRVWDVQFRAGGDLVASAGEDGRIRIWSAADGKEIGLLGPGQRQMCAVAFSPDGLLVAGGGGDARVDVWEVETGKEWASLDEPDGCVWSVAFSPDGRRLAAAAGAVARIWRLDGDRKLRSLSGHTSGVKDLAFVDGGETVATGSDDTTVKLWDTATGQLRRTMKAHWLGVAAVAGSPDGSTVASSGGRYDGSLKLWDVARGRRFGEIDIGSSWVIGLAFHPTRPLLAAGGHDGAIRIWALSGSRVAWSIPAHDAAVSMIAFSPDGRRLASAGWDGRVRLWDLPSEILDG